ncbi:hypothetical protein ACH9DO_16125 [Kocuria sp. M1N1S27]|uniref:hypothetical protein n=1 Tax=Kocuria kalidii TaxID=3376283 RepID=UPI0037A8FD27
MSSARSPQSTTRSADLVHVPLLPVPPGAPVATCPDGPVGDPRFRRAGLVQEVFTAAGEVEAAQWALDQVLEAAASGEEVGVGVDVAPLDGALESAHWALDRAVGVLHAELRAAAQHGVPLAVLTEASALELDEVRSVLGAAAPEGAALPSGELAPAG